MNNDKLQAYLKIAKRHLSRIVIGVLGLLLMAMLVTLYIESNAANDPPPSGKDFSFVDPIPKNEYWKKVQMMSGPRDITKYPNILQIRQNDMFTYKNVPKAEEMQRQVNAKFVHAQEAEKAGKIDDAIALCQDILKNKPNHKNAQELLARLQEKKKPGSSGGASPAGAPAAAAPAPTPAPVDR